LKKNYENALDFLPAHAEVQGLADAVQHLEQSQKEQMEIEPPADEIDWLC